MKGLSSADSDSEWHSTFSEVSYPNYMLVLKTFARQQDNNNFQDFYFVRK